MEVSYDYSAVQVAGDDHTLGVWEFNGWGPW